MLKASPYHLTAFTNGITYNWYHGGGGKGCSGYVPTAKADEGVYSVGKLAKSSVAERNLIVRIINGKLLELIGILIPLDCWPISYIHSVWRSSFTVKLIGMKNGMDGSSSLGEYELPS